MESTIPTPEFTVMVKKDKEEPAEVKSGKDAQPSGQ